MRWSSNPTSTPSWSPAGCCAARAASGATALLEKIVAGTAIVALAAAEADVRRPLAGRRDHRRARRTTVGCSTAAKIVAIGAPLATHLLITATHAGGPVVVPRRPRLGGKRASTLHGYRTVDDRRAADLVLDGLRLPAGCAARRGGAGMAVTRARRATKVRRRSARRPSAACERCWPTPSNTASSASSSGSRSAASRCSQHRMVDMHIELEQAVAAVLLAVLNLEPTTPTCGRGRCRPRRRRSAAPPASSASRPCNCTAAWA